MSLGLSHTQLTSRPTGKHILLLKFSMDPFSYVRLAFSPHHWILDGPIFRGLIFLVDVFTMAVARYYRIRFYLWIKSFRGVIKYEFIKR